MLVSDWFYCSQSIKGTAICWKSFLVDSIIAIMIWTELPTNTILIISMVSKTIQGETMLLLKDQSTKALYNVIAPEKLCKDLSTDDVIYRDENCICELCI